MEAHNRESSSRPELTVKTAVSPGTRQAVLQGAHSLLLYDYAAAVWVMLLQKGMLAQVTPNCHAAGSPSSSTSCLDAQTHFARALNAAQASACATDNCEQAEKQLPVRRRHSRKPARAQPILLAAPSHQAAATEEPQKDLEVQPPAEDKRSRHKPKKLWAVSNIFVSGVLMCLR